MAPMTESSLSFDHDTDGWGELLIQRGRRSMVIPLAGEFKQQTPLQAADHLAWEMHSAAQQVLKGGFAPERLASAGRSRP